MVGGEAEAIDLGMLRSRVLCMALGTVLEGRPFHHPVCILREEVVKDEGARGPREDPVPLAVWS